MDIIFSQNPVSLPSQPLTIFKRLPALSPHTKVINSSDISSMSDQ